MENLFPSHFDVIVIGTGMVESIVSASASRIGKRVLHIDNNDFYGGLWASVNLDTACHLDKHIARSRVDNNVKSYIENEDLVEFGNDLFDVKNYTYKWHIPENQENCKQTDNPLKNENGVNKENQIENVISTRANLLLESRKFNIDLMPKLHFARGEYVELLISSNIARYSEYRSVSRVLTWVNGQLEVVPCSRSDVFSNNRVSVIEKRMLMKLLNSIQENTEELIGYENKTFYEFLKNKRLTPNLINYVLYAISMSGENTSCKNGIEKTKRFLNSLSRFGKTPFLFSMYGSGESAQAFCRMSAVFGGTFALNQPLKGYVSSQNKFVSLLCDKQHISADHFIIGVEKAPKTMVQDVEIEYISRAVLITDKSVMASEKEHLTLLLHPPENDKNPVTALELGCLTGTCPKNVYLVHLISKQKTNPEEDFQEVIANLFSTDFESVGLSKKPVVLWSCYFSLPDCSKFDFKNNEENVHLCCGPDLELDYNLSIIKAKQIFSKMYPEDAFLPRAPDPEEIVIEGEETKQENEVKSTDEDLVDNIKNK